MKAERYNQRRASGLAVLVMDLLRAKASEAQPLTMWALNKAISERYELNPSERKAQYHAVRVVLKNLEAAGMVASRKEWDANNERNLKYIWPC